MALLSGFKSAETVPSAYIGVNYFYEGRLQNVCGVKEDYYSEVEDTYPYSVKKEIIDEDIHEMFCECLYAEEGDYCKHMPATLMDVEQNLENILIDEEIESKIIKRSKGIEEYLNNISNKYIADIALDNVNVYKDL